MARRRYDLKSVSKALGQKVRLLRHEKGWTLEECESHGWQNWRVLQEIETGKSNITVQTIINLSNLFGVHPSALFETV